VGVGANDNSSFPYTGGFSAEAVDEYTLDINCDQPCPIFPNTSIFVTFEAPDYLTTTPDPDWARQSIGFGPYQLVDWQPGVDITEEAYEDYVPAGDHYEFQKPFIKNLRWLWRGEPTVMIAMVESGEADVAWDVGVDAAKALPENMIKAGSSAETFALTVDTLWHPELKKTKVRQAIVHAAINCQEMVDVLYSGLTTCRGNIIFPGVIGATPRNTAPYEYNLEMARQLLEEANYDLSNLITIMGRATRIPKNVEVYEATKGYLDQVGMNVEIELVEASVRRERTGCGIGLAVNEVMQAAGKDPNMVMPTREDFQAAIDKGCANCPYGDLIENEPSNETLDLGRQANQYMSCVYPRSLVCDPSPGGIQDQIDAAMAAAGAERQEKMAVLADRLPTMCS
jgi:ABC-type transport system substrate-binding protein